MRHVLVHSTSEAQRAKAEERLAAAEQEAASLTAAVGDPDAVPDERGHLPAERRSWHLHSLFDWRHRTLRELTGWRFNAVLSMPALAEADMCSECEAPANWHTYAVSLCLYRGTPEPGSRAETIARLMPGWWSRCVACTPYQLEHRWGGPEVLPDFGADQWVELLPRCCGRYSPRTTSRRVSPGGDLTRAAGCNGVSARTSGRRQTCASS